MKTEERNCLIVAVTGIAFTILSVVILVRGCRVEQRKIEVDRRTAKAYWECERAVEKQLELEPYSGNFPSTYDFGETDDHRVEGKLESSWADYLQFYSYVDFENDAGALIRRKWTAYLLPDSFENGPWNPTWKIRSLEFVED